MWHLGRDVGSGCYPDVAQGFGGGAGSRPNVTFGTKKNYQSAARDWVLPLALGCYPDMAPAASPWALAAILTWHRQGLWRRVLVVAQGLGCGQS